MLKLALAILAVACALAVTAFKYHTLAALGEQNRALGRKVEELRQLEAENQRLYGLLAELGQKPPERFEDEVARLRAELGRLRPQREEWDKLRAENRQLREELGNAVRPAIPKESWAYAGYDDPESACQSQYWASASGDPKLVLDSLCPEVRANWAKRSEDEIAAFTSKLQNIMQRVPSFQVLGQRTISDDQVELITNEHLDKPDYPNCCLTFKRVGSEWKFYGFFL